MGKSAEERGEFAFRMGMPTRVRAVRHHDGTTEMYEEPLFQRQARRRDLAPDDLLAGVSEFDLVGPRSRVGQWLAERQGSTGAGPDISYGYDERGDFGTRDAGGVSTTGYSDEDVGSADLFGQPAGGQEPARPRAEYRDVADSYERRDSSFLGDAGDYFDNRSSPTVDLGEGRSSVRTPRRDSTFASRKFRR